MRPWIVAALLAAAAAPAWPAGPKLSISQPILHEYEDGPRLAVNHVFRPGEYVYMSCRVNGFGEKKRDRERDVRLTYRLDPLDYDNTAFQDAVTGKVEETVLVDKDKDWSPKLRGEFFLPALALSGEYRILIHVKDEITGQEAETSLPFPVKGQDVELSETLVVRNFRFLRSEEDGRGLEPAAYRPGETLWARFEITGYKIGVKNHMQIGYGLAVRRADGSLLFEQPKAAQDEESPSYPKRYIPNVFNLKLDPGIAPGEYLLVLTARDALGNQEEQSEHAFRVEK